MKKIIVTVIVVAIILFLDVFSAVQNPGLLSNGTDIKVLLVYHPEYLKETPYILAAYESVLQEEGVPYRSADVFELISVNAGDLVTTVPVVILPDGLLQNVPSQFSEWIKEYLLQGGNVAVIYDVGIKNKKGYFMDRSAFADIVGLNYITHAAAGKGAFDHGFIKFASEASRDFLQIPLGKTIDRLVLSGYSYGELLYPIAKNEKVRAIPASAIYAYGITAENEKFPVIVFTEYLKGKVLYVDLPLGYLKANADDLLLRSTLRAFLFDVVGVLHIMNVEEGRGGIVINWHVDNNEEHITLQEMQETNLLRKGIPASFHVTAGDFVDNPGDDIGFDATGKGKIMIEMIQNYGVIGSHGGWAHNWFAKNIEDGVFTENEIREYIVKNNESLEKVVGYKMTEYSAPDGVHPQPVTTKILEDMGFLAYYYTGDTGSAPNRTFYEGKMVSDKVIAFPVMPFERRASLWEMRALDNKQESQVAEWMLSILEYAARNRTIRLVYSHPYNIQEYPQVVNQFIDKTEKMQNDKQLTVRSMSDFARFFHRFLNTTYAFSVAEKQVIISLKNFDGLSGICIALPKGKYKKPHSDQIMLQEDDRYYYLTLVGLDEHEKYITVDIL